MLYDPKWQPPEVKNEEWRNVLRSAADILEKGGWCTGSLERRTQHCAIGALWVAEGNSFIFKESNNLAYLRAETKGTAAWHLREYLRKNGHCGDIEVFEWNDNQIDGNIVISTMRKVADAV